LIAHFRAALKEEFMSILKLLGVAAFGAAMAFGGSSSVVAKAHDPGQADGVTVCSVRMLECQSARDQIDVLTGLGVLDGHGVSAVQNKGKRGAIQSGAEPGSLRVDPHARPQGFPPGQNKTY
jgi:hypothetical protein